MTALSSFAAAMVALVGAIFIGRNADAIGHRFRLVDTPDQPGGRKQHLHPTPLVGGLAVCLAAILAAVLAIGSHLAEAVSSAGDSALGIFAFGVAAMYFIGAADDRHTLSPRTRLGVSILVLLGILSSDQMFSLGQLQFTGGLNVELASAGMFFTLVCLVGLLNAVNMADGKNGLVIGLSLIWCAVLATRANELWYPVLAAMSVSLAVMGWFNMRGKLFLGDGGSYGLSSAFGLMAIHIHNTNPEAFAAEQVALLFAVPVLDTIRLMVIRAKRGASPFIGDSDHLHHHLARRWGWPNGLYVYCALVAVPNLVPLLSSVLPVYCLAATVIGYGLVIVLSHAPEPSVAVPATPDNVARIDSARTRPAKRPASGRISEDAA